MATELQITKARVAILSLVPVGYGMSRDEANSYAEAAIKAAAEWLPIMTAPKDGTFVMLHSPDGEQNPWLGQWIDDTEFPDGGAWWQDNQAGFPVDADPSHWLPLPDLPKI